MWRKWGGTGNPAPRRIPRRPRGMRRFGGRSLEAEPPNRPPSPITGGEVTWEASHAPTPSRRKEKFTVPRRAGWAGRCVVACRTMNVNNGTVNNGNTAHASYPSYNRVRPSMLTLSNCVKPYLTSYRVLPYNSPTLSPLIPGASTIGQA